jgi:multisubunit Na+/H+ antiporter MnhC subunit
MFLFKIRTSIFLVIAGKYLVLDFQNPKIIGGLELLG